MAIRDLILALKDRVILAKDDSPEATSGLDGCGFTQEEIDAAPEVDVVELDEGE